MRHFALTVLASLHATMFTTAASAQTIPVWAEGKITELFAEPSRFTVRLTVGGPCGDGYFSMPINSPNQDAFVAFMISGATSRQNVRVWVYGCQGARNLVDTGHLYVPL